MAPRLSGQNSIFGVVFFVSKSLLGIERQKKLEKFAILTRKPRSHARILIYRTWPISTLYSPKRLGHFQRIEIQLHSEAWRTQTKEINKHVLGLTAKLNFNTSKIVYSHALTSLNCSLSLLLYLYFRSGLT